jgi:hypothetical protein
VWKERNTHKESEKGSSIEEKELKKKGVRIRDKENVEVKLSLCLTN